MSEWLYEVRGYSEDVLVDENGEYITAQERIDELETKLWVAYQQSGSSRSYQVWEAQLMEEGDE